MKGHVISTSDRFVLCVFLMDYHSGHWSRGYRLLSRMRPAGFTSSICDDLRQEPIYDYFVSKYADKV